MSGNTCRCGAYTNIVAAIAKTRNGAQQLMFPFSFSKATDERSAFAAASSGARYIAGGTTLVDLMRETVERPAAVVDINGLPYRSIDLQSSKLRIGSLVRMSDPAANLDVSREFPVIAQALELSASAQLRNVASIGGNCYDGGRRVNPKLAHSQAISGMVAGIGMTLLEGIRVGPQGRASREREHVGLPRHSQRRCACARRDLLGGRGHHRRSHRRQGTR
jgi:CO/xanthine dehydrogenase FAD-binding subunit